MELEPAHVGPIQPVQDEDNLAEQRGVGEEPRERTGDFLQRVWEVDVYVEALLELGAEPQEDASDVV